MSQPCAPSCRAEPPFRKRRPKLFIFLLVVCILLVSQALFAIWSILDAKGFFSGPRLGLVRIEGFISDAERTVDWIEKLRNDGSVAGVLVRIDSPGGVVTPSQEVYTAMKRLAKAKPVVVSMGSVAASGGYYVAVAGKTIFANPSTLTGSIGVRLQLTNVEGLMERIGVSSESLTTGKFKAAGSPFRELSPEDRAYLQGIIDDMQAVFVEAVAEGRNLPKEAVLPLADGRVFTGRQALEVKLVDRLGDMRAATVYLAGLCSLPGEPKMVEGPEKITPWWKRLLRAAMDISVEQSGETARFQFYY